MELSLAAVLVVVALGVALFVWRSKRDLRRTELELEARWQEALQAARERREAAQGLLDALKQVGYAPQSHAPIAEALDAIAEAEGGGPAALAEAGERLRAALGRAYAAMPPDRMRDVQEAHERLAEAEDELDLLRQRYNDLVVHQSRRLGRFRYRMVARWAKVGAHEPYASKAGREALLRRHRL